MFECLMYCASVRLQFIPQCHPLIDSKVYSVSPKNSGLGRKGGELQYIMTIIKVKRSEVKLILLIRILVAFQYFRLTPLIF